MTANWLKPTVHLRGPKASFVWHVPSLPIHSFMAYAAVTLLGTCLLLSRLHCGKASEVLDGFGAQSKVRLAHVSSRGPIGTELVVCSLSLSIQGQGWRADCLRLRTNTQLPNSSKHPSPAPLPQVVFLCLPTHPPPNTQALPHIPPLPTHSPYPQSPTFSLIIQKF